MTDREIELKLKKAVEVHTPDVLDNILTNCGTQEGKVIYMKKKTNWTKYASIAAAFVLVAGLGIFGLSRQSNTPPAGETTPNPNVATQPNTDTIVASTVLFDINPSIELQVNAEKKVLAVHALNDDAKKVLNGMELTGTNVSTATNAIVGALLKNGYIDELANSILVSVEDTDAQRGAQLQNEIAAEIDAILSAASINASVLSQYVDDDWKDVSDKYEISRGKAALIESILAVNDTYSEAELAKLSVNELNLLLTNPVNKTDKVTTKGNASQKSYIGKAKAKKIALKDAGVKASDIFGYEVEFDYDDGYIVYEIEFSTYYYEYDYEIDAKKGKIIKKHTEPNDDYAEIQPEKEPTKDPAKEPQKDSQTITESKAKSIAFNHAGVKASEVRGLRIEKERDDGRWEYQIEFRAGNEEYDYEIHAETGKILDYDIERDDDDDDHDDD